MPNGRCAKHGGKSLAGADAPAFRHGRYSRVLPSGLLALYEQARSDPDLLNLSDELALIDGRLSEIFGRADPNDPIAIRHVWIDAADLIERRRRLVDTETKRRLAGQQVITADQALVMLRFVQQAVDDEVTDPVTRRRIAARLQSLVEGVADGHAR